MVSKNQTEPDSLVGGDTEQLSGSLNEAGGCRREAASTGNRAYTNRTSSGRPLLPEKIV
jgi:hypothetical protein